MKRLIIFVLMALAFFATNNSVAKGCHGHMQRYAKFVYYRNSKKKYLKRCCARLRNRCNRKKLMCK